MKKKQFEDDDLEYSIEDKVSIIEEAEYTPSDILKSDLNIIIKDDDLIKIKDILLHEHYPELNDKDKEFHIFNMASYFFKYYGESYNILKYLIFDYQIKEEDSIKKFFIENEPVEKLFAIRRLNENLNSTLTNNLNTEQSKRKPKI
jgi:hypothetical protein